MNSLELLHNLQDEISNKICNFKNKARKTVQKHNNFSDPVKLQLKAKYDVVIEAYIEYLEKLEKIDLSLKQRAHDILIEERKKMKYHPCKMKHHRSM